MKPLLLTFLFLLSWGAFAQSLTSPAGRWVTIDEDSGEKKSVIEITQGKDGIRGQIVEILTANKDALCEKCSGRQKNKPMLGLTIIRGLEADGDHWSGGTILDPQKGTEYRLSVWYEDDNPNLLYVRGKHWTGFYRTQTWLREGSNGK